MPSEVTPPKIEARLEFHGPLVTITEWPTHPSLLSVTGQTTLRIFALGLLLILLAMIGVLAVGYSWHHIQTFKY